MHISALHQGRILGLKKNVHYMNCKSKLSLGLFDGWVNFPRGWSLTSTDCNQRLKHFSWFPSKSFLIFFFFPYKNAYKPSLFKSSIDDGIDLSFGKSQLIMYVDIIFWADLVILCNAYEMVQSHLKYEFFFCGMELFVQSKSNKYLNFF